MCFMIDSELCQLLARSSVIADDAVGPPAVAVDPVVPITAGMFAFALWIGSMAWS